MNSPTRSSSEVTRSLGEKSTDGSLLAGGSRQQPGEQRRQPAGGQDRGRQPQRARGRDRPLSRRELALEQDLAGGLGARLGNQDVPGARGQEVRHVEAGGATQDA